MMLYRCALKFTQFVSLLAMAGSALLQTGCQPACLKMEPQIVCPVPVSRICSLPSAFPPLTCEERAQEWGKELLIGDVFAREWDLYRAITSYKRALILLPCDAEARRLQIDYNLILCYYLGNKCQEAINIFEDSSLSHAGADFPAFKNLLLTVFDCYHQTQQDEKAACVLEAIRVYYPDSVDGLSIYWLLKDGEMDAARCLIAQQPDAEEMEADFAVYDRFAKSPSKARALNAILPGAGYYYVGQRNSAWTSFIINALFIAASYEFFRHGYPAAGIITASLETGWYFGGINGAGIEANEFNTRLFEGVSKKIMTEHFCFPIFMFKTSF